MILPSRLFHATLRYLFHQEHTCIWEIRGIGFGIFLKDRNRKYFSTVGVINRRRDHRLRFIFLRDWRAFFFRKKMNSKGIGIYYRAGVINGLEQYPITCSSVPMFLRTLHLYSVKTIHLSGHVMRNNQRTSSKSLIDSLQASPPND